MLKYECDECDNELEKDEIIHCSTCVDKRDTRIDELLDANRILETRFEETEDAAIEYEKQIAELQGKVAELQGK